MTWGEFKKSVEAEGVKDEDELDYIDCLGACDGISVAKDEDGVVAIS